MGLIGFDRENDKSLMQAVNESDHVKSYSIVLANDEMYQPEMAVAA